MADTNESFHQKKEKLQRSIETMRRNRLSDALEQFSHRKAPKPPIPTVETWPQEPPRTDRAYLAIKGFFRTRISDGLDGLFVLVADGTSGEPAILSLWVGYGGLKDVEVDASWQALLSLIERQEALQDTPAHDEVVSMVESFLSPPTVNRLASSPQDDDRCERTRDGMLQELTQRMGMSFEVSLALETVAGADLLSFWEDRQDKAVEEPVEESETTPTAIDHINLTCGVIVDPVRGCPVTELKPGTSIYVTIKEGSAIAYAIRKAMAQGRLDRIPATLLSVTETKTGNMELTVELSEGIYGKALAGESFKVAVAGEGDTAARMAPSMWLIWFLAASGALIVVAFMLLTT